MESVGIYRRQHSRSAYRSITAEIVAAISFFVLLFSFCPKVGAFLLAATVHEVGHLTAAHLFGANPQISFGIMGLKIKYSDIALGTAKSCIVCAAGSAVGMISSLTVIFCPLSEYDIWMYFALVSATLSGVNMLPIKTLDGGTLLELVSEKFLLPHIAQEVTSAISLIFSAVFLVLAVYIYFSHGAALSLLLIATYFIFASILDA